MNIYIEHIYIYIYIVYATLHIYYQVSFSDFPYLLCIP